MRHHSQQAFSLVELSIVLVIVGVMIGGTMAALSYTVVAKHRQTEMKMQAIEQAMAGFVTLYKRLPCPADGSLTSNHSGFGLEVITGDDCADTAPYASDRVRMGVVPTRTLQLPDEFMVDGWGRRMSYGVDYYFASAGDTNNFFTTTGGQITVLGEEGITRTPADNAVYVLISYGNNGHGAWNGGGGSHFTIQNYGQDEYNNAHMNGLGEVGSYDRVFVQRRENTQMGTGYFDDIVHFKMKSHILQEAGMVVGSNICTTADSIVIHGNTLCEDAAKPNACALLATTVQGLCL